MISRKEWGKGSRQESRLANCGTDNGQKRLLMGRMD